MSQDTDHDRHASVFFACMVAGKTQDIVIIKFNQSESVKTLRLIWNQ